MKKERHGLMWEGDLDDAWIEREFLRHGGYITAGGGKYGKGLWQHFKNYWSLLWPDDSQTRWTDLILKELLEQQFVAIIGPASSWKTSTVARASLMDWSLFPECTTIAMCSTDMEGLRARVYGETSKMWGQAYSRFEWWPGHPLDHRCIIANEDIDEDDVRDCRNAIIGIPNKTADGKVQGMGKFAGRKNTRVWSVCDETQFCERSFCDAQNNLVNNGPLLLPGFQRDPAGNILRDSFGKEKPIRGYKCTFIGNPNPTRPENCLHVVSEPEGGWNSIPEDGKTKVWNAKQVPNNVVKCRVISLDGADSPNNDYPGELPRWPQLINAITIAKYQKDSEAYWTQGRGVVKLGLAGMKIITKELCEQFSAFDGIEWKDGKHTRIGFLDAAYGGLGGDRAAAGWLEFGECTDGVVRIFFHPHFEVPVVIRPDMIPEDQIANFIKVRMEQFNVPPENFFFDGRGSMALSFARIWSPLVNTVEFGGVPTERLAGPDLFINDPKTGLRRLKTAREAYSKFVSELWWSWRYCVESNQVRGLSLEAVLDAAPREWYKVKNDKIEIEPKKEMKKRTGCSPDIADAMAVGIEGARRRGFKIASIAAVSGKPDDDSWFDKEQATLNKTMAQYNLQHA